MSLLTKKSNQPSVFSDFFETDRFFDNDFFNNRWLTKVPATNIQERDNDFFIELAVPGMTKKDFNITVENNLLTISSEKEEEKEEKKKNYTRQEFSYSSFSRSFNLPDSINGDKVNAKYENGVLSIVLPKKEEAKKQGKKKVDIA